MKRSKNKQNDSEAAIESVFAASIETLQLGIDAIRDEIRKVVAGKGGKSRHDAGSRIAFMTSRVGSIADSLRKVEAARAKRFDKLTPAMVLAWLRQLEAAERAQVLREAAQIDSKGSGLA